LCRIGKIKKIFFAIQPNSQLYGIITYFHVRILHLKWIAIVRHWIHTIDRAIETLGRRAGQAGEYLEGEGKGTTVCFTLTVVMEGVLVSCKS